ncbi:MAG: Gfo/Idh/MocA family oxidoreductase [Planctomycetaceae bacterium]|nr:Gfo/Idh/MocA family oxidoreductase [Planctomycetaceae bacterium]
MALRIGMLGMWHVHATGMARQIAAHPDEFELVGCFDPEPNVVRDRVAGWREFAGELPLCDSAEDLLRQPLDAVLVEGRVYDNVRWARMALESGRPVLLEKPAGDNVRDFAALVELAQARSLHVQMIYLFRYMSAVRELLERGRRGDFGRLYEFRGRLPKDLKDYAVNEREVGGYGGGIFFEMAGHLIDFMVALLGPPRKIHSLLRHHHTAPGAFIDNGAALFEFEHALGIVEVPALEVAGECRRIELYGDRGACVIPHLGSGHLANNAVQPVEIFTPGTGWQRLEPRAATLQIADLREFAEVLAGRKQPEFSLEHDLTVHQALVEASGMAW